MDLFWLSQHLHHKSVHKIFNLGFFVKLNCRNDRILLHIGWEITRCNYCKKQDSWYSQLHYNSIAANPFNMHSLSFTFSFIIFIFLFTLFSLFIIIPVGVIVQNRQIRPSNSCFPCLCCSSRAYANSWARPFGNKKKKKICLLRNLKLALLFKKNHPLVLR